MYSLPSTAVEMENMCYLEEMQSHECCDAISEGKKKKKKKVTYVNKHCLVLTQPVFRGHFLQGGTNNL